MDRLITSVLEPNLSREQEAADVIVRRRGPCLLIIFRSEAAREWLWDLIAAEDIHFPCLFLVEDGHPIVGDMRDDGLLIAEV